MNKKIRFMKQIVEKYDQLEKKFNNEILNIFFARLPEQYFILTDLENIVSHLNQLPAIITGKKTQIFLESEYEKFFLIKNDTNLIRETLAKLYTTSEKKTRLLRMFKDKKGEFYIISYYIVGKKLNDENQMSLRQPDWKNLKLLKNKKYKYLSENHVIIENKSILKYELANISSLSLVRNLLETVEGTGYSYIRLWMVHDFDTKHKSLYKVKIIFTKALSQNVIDSINEDIFRYVQNYMQTRSIFDIVGPSMVGPSSSHTAGANLIGQITRNIYKAIKEKRDNLTLHSIRIKLLGSFRDTGLGHHTPQAVLGGLSGFSTYSEEMIEKGKEIIDAKIIDFCGEIIPFNGFLLSDSKDDKFYEGNNNSNIVEINLITNKGDYIVTGFSIGGGNVEIRYLNKRRLYKPLNGNNSLLIDINLPEKEPLDLKLAINVEPVIITKKVIENTDVELEYNTFEEMEEFFGKEIKGKNLIDKIIDYEKKLSGESANALKFKVKKYWNIMENSIQKGINDSTLTDFKLSGDDAKKMSDYFAENRHIDSVYSKAARYAVAVNEINAKNGLIVACPTGGSCGILPAILQAWKETNNIYSDEEKDERIKDALLVAGFFGMILFDDVKTAGADLGCQAEIGGGTAMAAAAFVFLEDGNLEQMLNGFTLSLKNCMGLVCDPVAGLVEVPCVKRNGVFSSVALTTAYMGLAGVTSKISVDEVVLAIKEVGERMPSEYKETAQGGLAKTRDGKKIENLLKERNKHFFKEDR